MADNSVNVYTGKCVVMNFLMKEGIKPAEIYRWLQSQYGDETLSCSKKFEWCKFFEDGRTSATNDPGHGESQTTDVILQNIQIVKQPVIHWQLSHNL